MKSRLYYFALATILLILIACGGNKGDLNNNNNNNNLNSFDRFVASFPVKVGDLHTFDFSGESVPNNNKALDTLQLASYLPLEKLKNLPYIPEYEKPIYPVSKLNIKDGITSLIFVQWGEDAFYSKNMFLVNYDSSGILLSTQALAYEFGGASTYFSLESQLKNGVFKFNEIEGQRRPQEGQKPIKEEFSLEMTDSGKFRPSVISPDILGTWTEVMYTGGHWARYLACESGENSFEIILGKQIATFTGKFNGELFSYEIRAIKQTGYSFVISMVPGGDLEDHLVEIEINVQSDMDGLVQINNRYNKLFNELYFTNFKRIYTFPVEKEEGCTVPLELITEEGVAGISIGMEVGKLNDVIGLRKITQQRYDDMEGAIITYYDMEDPQSDSVYIIAEADGERKYVNRIFVKSPKYKTDRGIGVGSTLADIASNYEIINILSGDIGLVVSTSSFENILFMLDESSYHASEQEVRINDVPSGLKVIAVFYYK